MSMDIFFAASTQQLEKSKLIYGRIVKAIKSHGDSASASWIVNALGNKKDKKTSKELVMYQNQLIKECDAMIVEASIPSFGVGYLLAQALNERKPILCLYPEDRDVEVLSDGIKGSTSSLITLKFYNKKNLETIVSNYLDGLMLNPLQKFNFIASKDIITFIEQQAQKEGKSKSEFLRDLIVNDHMKN